MLPSSMNEPRLDREAGSPSSCTMAELRRDRDSALSGLDLPELVRLSSGLIRSLPLCRTSSCLSKFIGLSALSLPELPPLLPLLLVVLFCGSCFCLSGLPLFKLPFLWIPPLRRVDVFLKKRGRVEQQYQNVYA